ncbi:VCBS repeat-containing protein [Pirellulales bacterium]|nr:VCBS repeat-containing protein [Pirellulales bacterium]
MGSRGRRKKKRRGSRDRSAPPAFESQAASQPTAEQKPRRPALGRWVAAIGAVALAVGTAGLSGFLDFDNADRSLEDSADDDAAQAVAQGPPDSRMKRPDDQRQLPTPAASDSRGRDDTVANLPKLPTSLAGAEAQADVPNWETETLHEASLAQLTRLAHFIEQLPTAADPLGEIVAGDFICSPLRPQQLTMAPSAGNFSILRGATGDEATVTGAAGLQQALRDMLAESCPNARDAHVKFKQYRVEAAGTRFSTEAYFNAHLESHERNVQINAVWKCVWLSGSANQPPKLERIEVADYEEASLARGGATLFSDCTEAAVGQIPAYPLQFSRGMDYWLGRLERRFNLSFHGNHGLAVGDANGDGREDMYICQTGGLPNRLLLQTAEGRFEDVSAKAGVDVLDFSRSALFLDLDDDGDQDLVIGLARQVLLMENQGDAKFALRNSAASVVGATSLAAADYDRDGDLDVYVCAYSPGDNDAVSAQHPVPYHDANNGTPNVLLENQGDWQFRDVTADRGLDENNRRFSFAAAWEDYDNDGDLDLYVANDFGRNNLYRNDGNRFHDAAASAGVEDISAGMSASWSDYNQDGWFDLYVSNMFSSAGNRVAYQRRFKPEANAEVRAQFQRHARGNTLFENQGDGTFRDVSREADVTMGRWAWGSLFVDLNNDSREDLVVLNGYRTGHINDDL